MENSNFTEYKFENYDVRGLKLEINFSKSDSIKIKAHEEINIPIENDIDESFEPLLFGIDMNLEIINNINDLKGKKMILLDGHHRYEYLKRNNIDKLGKITLVLSVSVTHQGLEKIALKYIKSIIKKHLKLKQKS